MKAMIATQYGSSDVLQLKDVDKPSPKVHEIRVKVIATTVNVGDVRMRGFIVPPMLWLPARLALGLTKLRYPVLGMELSGVVDAIGSKVTRFKVGDAIFASTSQCHFGAHAEYKCLDESGAVALKPTNLSFDEAATLPVGAFTALYFLKKGKIGTGKKILINGASGSVGSFAVQLAKYFGAQVTGVSSTANHEMLKALGADYLIDYTQTDIANWGDQFDLVFDAVGKTTRKQAHHLLTDNGVYLNTLQGDTANPKQQDLLELKTLAEAGHLKPVIDRYYGLEQLKEAHQYVETGHKKGNVLVQVSR